MPGPPSPPPAHSDIYTIQWTGVKGAWCCPDPHQELLATLTSTVEARCSAVLTGYSLMVNCAVAWRWSRNCVSAMVADVLLPPPPPATAPCLVTQHCLPAAPPSWSSPRTPLFDHSYTKHLLFSFIFVFYWSVCIISRFWSLVTQYSPPRCAIQLILLPHSIIWLFLDETHATSSLRVFYLPVCVVSRFACYFPSLCVFGKPICVTARRCSADCA